MYRYVHLIDIISGTVYCIDLLVICRRVFEELSSESESEDTSELTCKKNVLLSSKSAVTFFIAEKEDEHEI